MSIANTTTARATVGTLFGAIASSADSVINIIQVGNTYISKLQLAADDSYFQQKKESSINRAVFEEQLIRSKAQEEAESALRAHEFMEKSATHKVEYQASYDRFKLIIAGE